MGLIWRIAFVKTDINGFYFTNSSDSFIFTANSDVL